jgi:hypothetical protein
MRMGAAPGPPTNAQMMLRSGAITQRQLQDALTRMRIAQMAPTWIAPAPGGMRILHVQTTYAPELSALGDDYDWSLTNVPLDEFMDDVSAENLAPYDVVIIGGGDPSEIEGLIGPGERELADFHRRGGSLLFRKDSLAPRFPIRSAGTGPKTQLPHKPSGHR